MNRAVGVILAAVGVTAAVVVVIGAARTTDARFIGTTSASGSVEAGIVELEAGTDTVARLIGIDLAPSEQIARCYLLRYTGTIDDVDVDLLAEITAGDGLEEHVAMRVERGRDAAGSDCRGFVPDETVLRARLLELDPEIAGPRPLWTTGPDDVEVWMRVTATIDDDPDAAGKSVDFRLLWRAAA